MVKATWRPGCSGFFKGADADLCANEIMSIRPDGEATPQDVVDKATDEGTELHKIFDWDNDVAGPKWRLHQARQILNSLVIEVGETTKIQKAPIRLFLRTEPGGSYKQTQIIFKNQDETLKVIEMARRELQTFKSKYETLVNLKDLIDEVFNF